MKKLLILILIIVGANAQIIEIDSNCGKSVPFQKKQTEDGEYISLPGQAGWQVLIKENQYFKCGGSLISKYWIITAASCVDGNLNPSNYLINLGLYNISDNQYTTRSVAKIVKHPSYDSFDRKYDIALIKMAGPVDLWETDEQNFNIIPVCVSDGTENYVNKEAIASGYASFTNGYIDTDKIKLKKQIKLQILNDEECENNHQMATSIDNFIQVCAVEEIFRELKCGMDRGGPLAVKGDDGRWHLVGISSFGYQPCDKGGVFTRIHIFADYILNVIRNE